MVPGSHAVLMCPSTLSSVPRRALCPLGTNAGYIIDLSYGKSFSLGYSDIKESQPSCHYPAQ